MTHDDALLQAIIANPDDDSRRLVYADWLEEHGQPEWAEFIRVQCELVKLPVGDARRPQLEARERQLHAAHQDEWLDALLGLLDRVPWLEHLGQPTARDDEVYRLHAWGEWPGPLDPDCYALAEFYQTCHDRLLDQAGPLREKAEALFQRVSESVRDRAKQKVPFDPEQDAWHAPTLCVWDVSYWAGLVAVHLLLMREIPEEVGRVWSWVAAGHWPCGYVEVSPAEEGRKLMVY